MKTIEITLYKFEELSEEVREAVVEKLWDINVEHDWWDFTYEDAERVYLKIGGFDIERGSYVNMDFIHNAEDTAREILKEHGESTETYKLAKKFLEENEELVKDEARYSTLYENSEEDSEEEENYRRYREQAEDDMEELCTEFLAELEGEYLNMLRGEFEFLTSEEAIIETIKVNDYDFTENGEIY